MMKYIMPLLVAFFTVGISFSILLAECDVQTGVEKIGKDFYDLNEKSMKMVAFFTEPGREGWQMNMAGFFN